MLTLLSSKGQYWGLIYLLTEVKTSISLTDLTLAQFSHKIAQIHVHTMDQVLEMVTKPKYLSWKKYYIPNNLFQIIILSGGGYFTT